jgi:hypothetical protein
MGVQPRRYDDPKSYEIDGPNAGVDYGKLARLLARVQACAGQDEALSHDVWWELVDRDSGAAREIDGRREVNITAGDLAAKPFWREPGAYYFGDAEEKRLLIDSVDRAAELVDRVLKGWRWQIYSGGGPDNDKSFACVYSGAGAFSARARSESVALIAALIEAKMAGAGPAKY